MATILQIKRSSGTTSPSELAQGELAYTYGTGTQGNNGDRLFIGTGTETLGVAANIDVIGGKYFTSLTDHAHGTLTASSAIIVDSNKAIDDLYVGNALATGGSIKFNEGTNNGSNYIALKAPNSIASNVTFTLPTADGTNGQALITDGSGNLSFSTISGVLTISDDSSSTTTINLGTETLKIAGGTGITSTISGDTVTLDIDNTVVTTTGTQTLTNKTFNVAVASGNVFQIQGNSIESYVGSGSNVVLSSSPTITNLYTSGTGMYFTGSTSGTTNVIASAIASGTLTLPAATDTLVGKATTDTLTNKTISGSVS